MTARAVTVALVLFVATVGCGGGGGAHDADAARGDAADPRGDADAPRETHEEILLSERPAADGADDTGDAEVAVAPDAADGLGADAADAADAPDSADAPAMEPPPADAAPDGDGLPPGPTVGWVSLGAPSAGNVSALAIAPDGKLYAGVGPDITFQGSVGSGIFVSSDSGTSWQPRNEGLRNFNVQAFALTTGPFLVATKEVARSTNAALTWMPSLVTSEAFKVLGADPAGALLFACDDRGSGLQRSEDGGVTWKPIPNLASANSVAVLGSVVLVYGENGLSRSTDGGKTFQFVESQHGSTLPNLSLPNLLCGNGRCYLAGQAPSTAPDFLLSTDDGATWAPIGKYNYFPRALARNGTLYVTSGQTLLRTDDGGTSWNTLPAPPAVPLTVMAADGNDVYAGTGHGIFRSHDKGQTWEAANGSVATGALTTEAGLLFLDTSSAAVSPNGDIYVAQPDVGLLRSIDDGASWSLVKVGFVPTSCVVTEAAGISCIRTGSQYLRSKDNGVTWQPWSIPPFTDQIGGVLTSVAARGKVVYVSGKPQATQTFQVARSDDGGLTFQVLAASPQVNVLQVMGNGHLFGNYTLAGETHRSTDDGATWTKLTTALSLPLAEDASNVLYRGYGGLQISTNEGDTWTYVNTHETLDWSNKKLAPLWFDAAGKMYLSMEGIGGSTWRVGPWSLVVSDDHGAHWSAFGARLPHPAISMPAFDKKGRLLVATNGGVYRLQ